MYVHEVIARTLDAMGVDTIFGLIGDGNLYMVDSFTRDTGGRFIAVANEATAVLAATGYSRTTGRLGVAAVTHGPALTNTITALIEAVRARTPLVLVAGDTAVVDRDNLQKIDQRSVILPTGAGFVQVRSPETIPEDVVSAFRGAELERRPFVLNIPADFQWQDVEYRPPQRRPVVRQSVRPSEDALDTALGIIASARRPLVLAGRGATSGEARAAVLGFARRVGAPVTTTLQARELFAGEPEDLGIFGTLSTDAAVDVIGQADCVVAFGAALNRWTTGEGSLLNGARVVQVDTDPAALNHHRVVDAPVVGDAAAVAAEFVRLLDEVSFTPADFAGRAAQLAGQRPAQKPAEHPPGTLDIDEALRVINRSFPAERGLVLDAGRFFHHAAFNVRTGAVNSYVHTLEFGCIGLGMGNAIGAAAASPGTPVLMISGDGGFMLGGLAEFSTAVRHRLDIVVVIMNDSSYGAEYIQFTNKGMDPSISTFEWPSFAAVASALGGIGYAVRTLEELQKVLDSLADRDRPALIEVFLDPASISSPYH
jgi:thiamine pyrophosphate-dependent acetolactate synthase large subunit-like protein